MLSPYLRALIPAFQIPSKYFWETQFFIQTSSSRDSCGKLTRINKLIARNLDIASSLFAIAIKVDRGFLMQTALIPNTEEELTLTVYSFKEFTTLIITEDSLLDFSFFV